MAPGGAFVVVENGSAKGSHTVRSARKMILRPTSLVSLEGEDNQSNRVFVDCPSLIGRLIMDSVIVNFPHRVRSFPSRVRRKYFWAVCP